MQSIIVLATVLVASTLGQVTDPNDACRGCRLRNGVGYKGHPNRCDQFYHCHQKEGQVGYKATLMKCACGLFWKQSLLTCVHSVDLRCHNDPCAAGIPSYAHPDNCGTYWVCTDRRSSDTMCCAANERYDSANRTCVVDSGNTCTDKCLCSQATTKDPLANCEFWSVSGKPGLFLWTFYGGSRTMHCPPGTNFNSSSCRCDITVNIPSSCLDLSIKYTELPLLDHGKGSWIDNVRVIVDVGSGTGDFSNNGYINVPRFSNIDWPRVIGIDIEFHGQGNANADAPLLENCDCNDPATISLRLGKSGANKNVVTFRLRTDNDNYTVQAEYLSNAWNRVKVAYDGTHILLSVQSGGSVYDSASIQAHGSLTQQFVCYKCLSGCQKALSETLEYYITWSSVIIWDIVKYQCGLKIGFSWQHHYYNGLMRRTDVYLNCLPAGFIG